MGLIKFLEKRAEERHRQAEAEKIYQRERQVAYQQGLQAGRVQGAYQKGRRQAIQESRKPSGAARVLNILGGIGEGSRRMEKSLFPEFSGFDPFGLPPRRHKKGKKGKGKTITIHVK